MVINDSIIENTIKKNPEIMEMSTKDLVRYIKQNHHRREVEILDELDTLMVMVLNAHYNDYDNLSQVYKNFMAVKTSLLAHFALEEKREFLNILQGKEVDIDRISQDHEEIISLLDELAKSTNGYTPPSDTCPSHIKTYQLMKDLEEDLQIHYYLEEEVLLPKVK